MDYSESIVSIATHRPGSNTRSDWTSEHEAALSAGMEGLRAQQIADAYRLLRARLVWRARRFGLSREDAQDVVQDAFALALTKLDTGGNPTVWLGRVVDHLSSNASRKARRRERLLELHGSG